jgi:hypoxanthine phosphoribosyltransferase
MSPKQIALSWQQVDKLVHQMLPQFRREFNAMVMITRGGIIPGGMLAEAMGLTHILTAAVDFPFEQANAQQKFMAWPQFIQFPADESLRGRSVLIVDDVWGSGRTITAVKNRVSAAGGFPETCVLHFNPYRSLFGSVRPDYYADVTDAHVVYPWEIDHGPDLALLGDMR